MKKQYFTIFLIALCVVCFGLIGCKKVPLCESKSYYKTGESVLTGSADSTENGEAKKVFFLDFDYFFQANGIELQEGDVFAVYWKCQIAQNYTVIGEGFMEAEQDPDCGWNVKLPKAYFYTIAIIIIRNGTNIFFSDANYFSQDSCYVEAIDGSGINVTEDII
jgi:hypothetical protein